MKQATRELLAQVSTATICTALFKRGLRTQFIQNVHPLNPNLPNMVGDAEGVVVIPAHLADEVAAEATEMTVFEDFVTEQVMAGRSIIGLYPPTDEQARIDFAAWRQRVGR